MAEGCHRGDTDPASQRYLDYGRSASRSQGLALWMGLLLEFVTLALPLGRFLSCLVSFEPSLHALNGTRGTEIRPTVTEILPFYFVLLITPKPSLVSLGFNLACVYGCTEARPPTFYRPKMSYIVAAPLWSPPVLSPHCWTSGMCSL